MKYFFAKIGYLNYPEELKQFDPWSSKVMDWERDHHNDQHVIIQNPNNIELPDLSVKPCHRAWDVLRNAGWYHRAVEGVSQLDSNGRLRSFTKDDFLIWVKPETDEELFETWMMGYDWYYEMSDDFRCWNAGQAMDNKLRALVKESKTLTPARAVEIWNKYAPPRDGYSESAPSRKILERWFTR